MEENINMGIGMNLTHDTRVELGEIKEKLTAELDEAGIEYSLFYNQLNKAGVKETFITIREPYAEISIENDIVTYIKVENTEFSNLDNIPDIGDNVLDHIKNIQKRVDDKFSIEGSTIKIEKIDTKTMNITLIIMYSEDRTRVQILRDTFGDVFINTLRKL